MRLKGYVDEVSHLGVNGWAIDWDDGDQPVELAILVDGQEHGRCRAALERPGLAHALGGHVSDRHGFSYRFVPSLDTARDISICVQHAATGTDIENGKRVLRAALGRRAPLMPILLTSRGRSGSTLLMSELAAHPEVAVADTYPFETKLLSYYVSAFRVLTSIQYAADPDFAERAADLTRIGGNPWNRPDLLHAIGGRHWERLFHESMPIRLNDLFRNLVTEAYSILATERGKTQARCFAEKTPIVDEIRQGIRDMFADVREIVLVRDPRDYLCSARLFWRQDTGSVLQMLDQALPALQAIQRAGRSDTLFLRYEDLVLTPADARQQLYRFLQLTPHVTDAPSSLPAEHRTSASPIESVGRWRRDLSAAEVATCNGRYRGFLEQFGYL